MSKGFDLFCPSLESLSAIIYEVAMVDLLSLFGLEVGTHIENSQILRRIRRFTSRSQLSCTRRSGIGIEECGCPRVGLLASSCLFEGNALRLNMFYTHVVLKNVTSTRKRVKNVADRRLYSLPRKLHSKENRGMCNRFSSILLRA